LSEVSTNHKTGPSSGEQIKATVPAGELPRVSELKIVDEPASIFDHGVVETEQCETEKPSATLEPIFVGTAAEPRKPQP